MDPGGNAYVAGASHSMNFAAVNGLQPKAPVHPAAGGDGKVQQAFAAKLDAAGGIRWSTLLTGSTADEARAIAADAGGNAYVAGWTASRDFPRDFRSTGRRR